MPVGLLDGLRVVELGPGVAAAFCGKLLADYGAAVLKAEPPGLGDPLRRCGPFAGDEPHPETGIPFLYLNTGKRGVTLNLADSDGQAILHRLLEPADAVIAGYTPAETAALGLDWPGLGGRHPHLAATYITAFGQTGPYRDFQATDLITCAMSGLMYHSGDSDREPLRNALEQSLYVAGANAAAATLTALFARLSTGRGQQVEVSVAECLAAHLVQPIPYYDYMGAIKGRRPVRGSGFEELMPARDGYVVPSVQGSQPSAAVAELIGLEELQDGRFASGAGRIEHGEELKRLLIEGLAQWDRLPLFLASGERRLVFGMAQDAGDLYDCPHLAAREFYQPVAHPVAGAAAYPGMGARLPGAAQTAPTPAPLLGQHNGEIYGGELGYAADELATLRYANII